ncbi:MAG: RES family NAD+ phosphorylase [Deltaproteobacteria bacterium]|nr:RES family NAD+ phosphorylase [Deltaproteobacteria bacterium]
MKLPPLRRVRWQACYRLIHTRSPTVDLFERIADPEDFEALIELESLHNPRIRQGIGDLSGHRLEEIPTKSRSSYILAPFAYPSDSRFGTVRFGVFYGARQIKTALAEVVYHRENFLKATREEAMLLEMRLLSVQLDARLYDLRGQQKLYASLYHPQDYSDSQSFGKKLKDLDSQGLAYDSVRDLKGQCVAIFKPQVLSHAHHIKYLYLRWNGKKIIQFLEEEKNKQKTPLP